MEQMDLKSLKLRISKRRLKNLLSLAIALSTLFVHENGSSQTVPYITVVNDTLRAGNTYFEAQYLWNSGNISLITLIDKRNETRVSFEPGKYPFFLKGEDHQNLSAEFRVDEDGNGHKTVAQIELTLGGLKVRRILTVYEKSCALQHRFFLKGVSKSTKWVEVIDEGNTMIENKELSEEKYQTKISHLAFNTISWKFSAIGFNEATDYHDNPISKKSMVGYRKPRLVAANLLRADHAKEPTSFFILKEAPIQFSQQDYPGFDFLLKSDGISVHGLGVSPEDLSTEWTQGYGYAIGLSLKEDMDFHTNLLEYQKEIRPYRPSRDFMIMANTWGDRSKDSRMNAVFIKSELQKASELGITHLQLDDGWQQGLSKNSASKAGVNWDDWSKSDWLPHATRFPQGFEPIMKKAKDHGLNLGLWFNPSKKDGYASWERDANILLSYFRKYGITTFKIDGMQLNDKRSETNLRRLFEKVIEESGQRVTFNLDVTAGNRMGYHFFQEYGNIFLENRYTDWGNYYPHRTLRNLWLLSHYVPAERFQMEFLNVARNGHNYPIKELAPGTAGQNYAFGVTMMAQPLAWMELTGLKVASEGLKILLKKYRKVAPFLHSGIILPMGQEPDGYSWPGFLSLQKNKKHYFAIYREYTDNPSHTFELPFKIKQIKYILGERTSAFEINENRLSVSFDQPWQFTLLEIETH